MNSIQARRLTISGVVQGVGFRPFLFQLADKYGFTGEVVNTAQGVTLVVEGFFQQPMSLDAFCADIYKKNPPLASVSDVKIEDIQVKGYSEFMIAKSRGCDKIRSALIPPDVSVCRDCLDEMNDPENRRYEYPFINCTNCGPRYTIIKDIPYDRQKTSMDIFKMCDNCRQEYDDPRDRRFHAQPNACPVCGPHVFLVDNRGDRVALNGKDSITFAANLLKQGKIVAVKGLGGFHLAADALNKDAVAKLRARKKRPDKPFALMAKSVLSAAEYVFINKREKELLQCHHRPIVLLEKKSDFHHIAPNNRYLGIMLPYTPLHYLLLAQGPDLLVMTSGNRSGEPLSIDNDDALDAFPHIADYFLLHNRDIYFRADDSIVQFSNGNTRFLRRSRGYAPLPLFLRNSSVSHFQPQKVLACGGGLKSTVCLTKENRAFVSQYIGDLDNPRTFEFYKTTIDHLKRILDIEPEIIACDMHPGYMSTEYAKDYAYESHYAYEPVDEQTVDHVNKYADDPTVESVNDSTNTNGNGNVNGNVNANGNTGTAKHKGLKIVPVQHHHAHAVSCMAENNLKEEVIAVTLDGTGFGTDGKIWGGEVLTCTETSFTRRVHLAYVPMPGSEAAVTEPWRMAAAYLFSAFGDEFLDFDIPFIKMVGKDKLEFLLQMIKKRINSPVTSSCGRLFDAVAAILGIRHKVSFESQAAMELEAAANFTHAGENSFCEEEIFAYAGEEPAIEEANSVDAGYDFNFNETVSDDGGIMVEIDFSPAIIQIVNAIKEDESPGRISRRFHKTVIDIFIKSAMVVSEKTGLKKAVLSGGVFNNSIILNGISHGLEKRGITVYTHTQVPCGDGGISLGQAVVAGARAMGKYSASTPSSPILACSHNQLKIEN
ncbi:MAG: carbamoyltransferase HypF [Thermodesulfobacteriota bacterium]|nr:carbamoyltransferase HypF [Thermodesulfobacteriota bacterium]